MKTRRSPLLAGLTLCAAGATLLPGYAQDDDITLDRNRLWVNARFAFNISAKVRTVSPPTPSAPPVYDDGFVLADSSGSADGLTWNWGYDRADQIAGTTLNLHRSTGSPRTGIEETLDGDPHAGFELLYGRVLGFFSLSKTRQAAWGISGGFTSLDINLERTSDVSGTVSRQTYAYNLGATIAPTPPYAGTFNGPGPAIGTAGTPLAVPAPTAPVNVAATSSQTSQIDALALGLKFGPFLELPVSGRLTISFGAGVAVVDVLNTFRFSESTQLSGVAGGPPRSRSEEYRQDEWLVGFYAGAMVSYALNYSLSVFAGAQYQHLGEATVTGGGKEATLDLGQSYELVVGLRAAF
jgi:opacity protein-like surface antigen